MTQKTFKNTDAGAAQGTVSSVVLIISATEPGGHGLVMFCPFVTDSVGIFQEVGKGQRSLRLHSAADPAHHPDPGDLRIFKGYSKLSI